MTNNLRKIKQELCSIVKQVKNFKYSNSALITFLMTGMVSTTNNLFSSTTVENIKKERQEISTSIKNIYQKVKETRKENNKLLRAANLELIQLMEQGEQIVKSNWQTWQIGSNYYYSNYNSVFKGKEDKEEKYPYENVFERDKEVMNRYYIPKENKNTDYGLVSTRKIVEPAVYLEINPGIVPKSVERKQNTTITLPVYPEIKFPVSPVINIPLAPQVVVLPPAITVPAAGNGDQEWIRDGGSVAPIAQQNMKGGTLTVTANGTSYDVASVGIDMTGEVGAGHNKVPHGVQNFNYTNQSQYAAMKLIGGHEINIEGVTIDYKGTGDTGYKKWLFHTDGHNDRGTSTWVLDSATKVNMDGTNLVLYTSQYHGYTPIFGNIGFVNDGVISTSATGSKNIGWIALDERGQLNRQQFFHNRIGTINLGGSEDIFAYIMSPTSGANSGWAVINDGTINMTGNEQFGIIVDRKYSYDAAQISLNKPIAISGTNSTGVVFSGWVKLDGGTPFSHETSDNIVTTLPGNSDPSIINLDLSGSKNTGVYFGSTATNPFNLNKFAINIDGNNNTGFYIANGIVNLGGTGNTINIKSGSDNIGIFAASSGDTLSTAADITITADKSTGIFAQNSGTVTSSGAITVTGASVKAIVADNANITSSGAVTVTGTAASATDGAVGLVAMNNGTVDQTGTVNISADGEASIGVFSQNGGTVKIASGTVKTTGGAFNTYAQGGTIEINGTTLDTGQKSITFFTNNSGVIKFLGPTIANIAGGTDINTRGSAFYYQGSGYSPFDLVSILSWASTNFSGTLSNLILNMQSGSRIFIVSDVETKLSNTNVIGLHSALGMTTVGIDYKTFLLGLSKLNIDQNVNLDNQADDYNNLEITNSIIINNSTMSGTKVGQIAIAQENNTSSRNKVQLINNGIIDLIGDNSTAIYGKFSEISNNGTINIKNSSMGIYGLGNSEIKSNGIINIGDNSIGIYSKNSSLIDLGTNSMINLGKDSIGAYSSDGGENVINAGNMTIWNNSYGFVFDNGNPINFSSFPTSNVILKGDATYIYSENTLGTINNSSFITSISDKNYGIYSNGQVKNYGNINFENGIGNVGIYSSKNGNAENYGNIIIGNSDSVNDTYSLGMAAGYKQTGDTGNIINYGVIEVKGNEGIGMYGTGKDTTVKNAGTINLTGDKSMGIYLEEGAKGENTGIIKTSGNPYGVAGIVVRKGAILTNYGLIDINSLNGMAVFKTNGGIIKNYGSIKVGNGAALYGVPETNKPVDKRFGGIYIDPKNDRIQVDGKNMPIFEIVDIKGQTDLLHSSIGMYIDTIKKTNPIDGLTFNDTEEISLIIGIEAANETNSKYIKVNNELLAPYAETAANSNIANWKVYSASLTWIATGTFGNMYMAKLPYTYFALNEKTEKNVYNFTDGLEQRYDVNDLDSREKILFNKLNSIGNNEQILLTQAFDEMMGHQYGNLQQRINATGNLLDKEFKYLKNDWRNPSK